MWACRESNPCADNFHGIHGAEHSPAFLGRAVFFRGKFFGGGCLVLEGIALAHGTENVRYIAVGDKLLRTEDVKFSVFNDARNLGCVIQPFRAFGHAEFGLDSVEKFLNVSNGVTGVVKVNDLLRFHNTGSLGCRHVDNCGVLIGHLRPCQQVDERVRESDEISVSGALLQFADGDMVDFRERVVPVAENGLSFGSAGSSEQVCDALQDIAEGFRGNGIFGLQLSELGNYLSEGFCINSHRRCAGGAVYGLWFISLLANLVRQSD